MQIHNYTKWSVYLQQQLTPYIIGTIANTQSLRLMDFQGELVEFSLVFFGQG